MLRRVRLILLVVALGAGLLAVPGVLPDPAPLPVVAEDGGAAVRVAAVDVPAVDVPAVDVPAVDVPAVDVPAAPTPLPADAAAGIRAAGVPQVGTGSISVVPGAVPAPGPGPVRTVRVEVEDGLAVDGAAFADFVLATLNDPRGWGRDGALSFARTDGEAAIVVVLASPDTAAALCRPLVTHGRLSCRIGSRAVLTYFRWVEAVPDYGDDRTGYRRYLVNHEVGHVLGHGHEPCPGPGAPAPVMQQQTKGLLGCAPNSWPHP
ncbi:DUF3152 domain-containing protein [Pseudonocardia saturnea]